MDFVQLQFVQMQFVLNLNEIHHGFISSSRLKFDLIIINYYCRWKAELMARGKKPHHRGGMARAGSYDVCDPSRDNLTLWGSSTPMNFRGVRKNR